MTTSKKVTFKSVDEKIASYNDAAIAAASIDDAILAKRTRQAAEHRAASYTRVATLDGKEARSAALTLLNRAVKDFSGNDAKKIASLATVVQTNDMDKLNAGFYKALIGLDKLTSKNPEKVEFSLTAMKAKMELKCNVKTSLTLLAKMTFLNQVKDGRAIVGYAINDRAALQGLLGIFK